MNVRCKYLAVFVLLCYTSFRGYAQTAPAHLKGIARMQDQKALLRWAPDQPSAWRKGNQYGYVLERYTIMRNGQLLAEPEYRQLVAAPLKPRPLADWEQLAQQSDYAAVLAQALYGDKFEVSSGKGAGPATIVAIAEEQEQRFGFALYAADLDFKAAQQAALGFVDKDVQKGERYLYRVYVALPGGQSGIDTAGIYIDTETADPLPQPRDLVAIAGDKTVMLSWDYDRLRHYYNSYIIERSEDGREYQALGDLPLTNLNDKEGRKTANIYYTDTLPVNERTYSYRVRGINAFGEKGPASDTVRATGAPVLTHVPFITVSRLVRAKELQLKWEFEAEGSSLLKEFTLNMAPKADGPYLPVMKGIKPGLRSAIYVVAKALEGSCYFTVSAVPLHGAPRTSFPVLVQAIDSIPPTRPAGLSGYIDSSGVARISWTPNKEPDMLGYRVFRAMQDGEEFSGISAAIFADNYFADSLQLLSLNRDALYRVVAVDKQFNNSAFSDVLRLRKPDVVPPAPASITEYKISGEQITITWQPGASTDVLRYALFRCDGNDTSKYWEVDQCTPQNIRQSMIDSKVAPGRSYTYFILTVDSSGLSSRSSQYLKLSGSRETILRNPGVKGLDVFREEAKQSLDLFWRYEQAGVTGFLVYRAEQDAPLTLWKTTDADTFRVKDNSVRPGKKYQYAVKAQFADGAQSQMQQIQITY